MVDWDAHIAGTADALAEGARLHLFGDEHEERALRPGDRVTVHFLTRDPLPLTASEVGEDHAVLSGDGGSFLLAMAVDRLSHPVWMVKAARG